MDWHFSGLAGLDFSQFFLLWCLEWNDCIDYKKEIKIRDGA
jgi:hypothetical protein